MESDLLIVRIEPIAIMVGIVARGSVKKLHLNGIHRSRRDTATFVRIGDPVVTPDAFQLFQVVLRETLSIHIKGED
jgi:hypothetical protein